ncbi:MAG: flagellar hook-basal body complex protein FliE [Nitrospinaceae bacterium]
MNDITLKTQLKSVLSPGPSFPEIKAGKGSTEKSSGFIKTLSESIDRVNELQKEADQAIEKLTTGESDNLHGAMLAVSKADLAFRMTMQVRNKMVEAYQEVMRMQI